MAEWSRHLLRTSLSAMIRHAVVTRCPAPMRTFFEVYTSIVSASSPTVAYQDAVMKCPVCSETSGDALCVCGYSFEDDRIIDFESLRQRIASTKAEHWSVSVRLVQAITRFQLTKEISGRQTARDLGLSVTNHHRTIKLADAIEKHPQLAGCRNEDAARRELASPGVDAFESEEKLQKYLEQNWEVTKLGSEWELVRGGHYDTCEIGIIDLLAKHRYQPRWLVVELKVRKTSDEVLGQVLRYMGWVKHRATKSEVVEGLIVALEPDTKTLFGLLCVPNVQMMCYQRGEGGFELCPASLIFKETSALLSKLSQEERKELMSRLENGQ